jgi:hypothetical protein
MYPPPETGVSRWAYVGTQRLSDLLGYNGPNDKDYKKMLVSPIGFLPPSHLTHDSQDHCRRIASRCGIDHHGTLLPWEDIIRTDAWARLTVEVSLASY